MFRRFPLFAIAVCIAAPCLAQSPAPGPIDLPLVYSTTPMTRNADLMLSASIMSTSATEAGLANISSSLFRSTRWTARSARAAKLALFDVPVAYYFGTLNHEWGHQTKASGYGVDTDLLFEGTPWSGQPFFLYVLDPMPDDPLAESTTQGGGMAASAVMKARAEGMMLRAERVPYGLALAAILASLDEPMYALTNLGSSSLSPERVAENWIRGDPSQLVVDLNRRRSAWGPSSLDGIRRDVRARSLLNLVDTALWSETASVLGDYVWKGEPNGRVRWLGIGGAQLLPSLRYELSPYGPEYYVRSHYRARGFTGTGYGRWTEPIGIERQVGGGFSVAGWSLPRVRPGVSVDAWSHTRQGFGMRGEVQVEAVGWPHERAALTVAAGAKSSGYLLGFPMDNGAYINAGVNVRVW